MSWQQLATIQTTTNWLLTESVTGSLFRITHNVTGTNIQSLRSVIAQAFDEGANNTYFDFRRLSFKTETEAFLFIQPGGLFNRKLAVKRLDNLADNWSMTIEVLDGMPESISLPIEMSEVTGLLEELQARVSQLELLEHTTNTSNPHGVTLSQVGGEQPGAGAAAAANAITTHKAEEDPHSQYATDATVTLIQSAVNGKEAAGTAAAAISSHVGEPDPHSQYATDNQIVQLQTAINEKQPQAENLYGLASLNQFGTVQRLDNGEGGIYFSCFNTVVLDQNNLIPLLNLPLILPVGVTIDYEGVIAANGILNENGLIWLLLDGASIGNTGSGATRYANVKAQTLFERLWSNTNLAIQSSTGTNTTKGATATEDFTANKRLALPSLQGRVVIPSGSGPGLSTRVRGAVGGAETHTLTINQIPSHSHALPVTGTTGGGTNPRFAFQGNDGPVNLDSFTSGGGSAHNNMPPYYVCAGKLILAGKA